MKVYCQVFPRPISDRMQSWQSVSDCLICKLSAQSSSRLVGPIDFYLIKLFTLTISETPTMFSFFFMYSVKTDSRNYINKMLFKDIY